ncbi:hypothetical protein [Limnohabitans sp.]|uniref:hypothetical protein n=1 Tax=Limnohabitans sp. TaxID=1907725 RepID=UPI00286F686C|nr:hypothetical protein [Limnohabitans sp.]
MNDWELIDAIWVLNESFTVPEAAALIVGVDPSKILRADDIDPNKDEAERRIGIAHGALTKAIATPRPKLRAQLRYDAEPRYVGGIDNLEERGRWGGEDVSEVKDWDGTAYVVTTPQPNLNKATLDREDLIAWLRSRGQTTGFFFPDAVVSDAPDYMNPAHLRYSPNLAAAVHAWLAMEDGNLRRGKSAKTAMENWLESRYGGFKDEVQQR